MVELRRADLAALSDLAANAHAVTDTDGSGQAILSALRRLVPADSVTYNEIDTRRHRVVVAVDPPDALDGLDHAAFTKYLNQHPVIAYSRQSGDGRAHSISDFLDRRSYHQTDLYGTCFQAAKVEHQLAITLAHTPSRIVGIALNRARPEFSARDRALLDLARIPLVTGYQAAETARQQTAMREMMDRALDDLRRGVIMIDSDGRVVAATSTAVRLLATHLGAGAIEGQRLPDCLASLGRGAISRTHPLKLEGQRAWLLASVVGDTRSAARAIVIDELPRGRLPPLGAAELTHRESSVLRLIADSRSNAEVAVALGVSIRTVHKHLEHLYTKLHVHDRTAAASRWYAEHGTPLG